MNLFLESLLTMSYKRWRKAQSNESRRVEELKLLFLPAQLVLPLLTTFLLVVSASAGIAQHSPVQLPEISQKNSASSPPKVSSPHLLFSGNQVSLNGRTLTATWRQWDLDKQTAKVRTAINDAGLMQLLGVELLNTSDAAKQPIEWFSQTATSPLVLSIWHSGVYRYLDVTQWAALANWQMQVDGDTLRITTPAARVRTIRQGKQPWGDRIVVDLDNPTPWQVSQQKLAAKPKVPDVELPDDPNAQKLHPQISLTAAKPQRPYQEWVVTIDATTEPAVLQEFNFSSSDQMGATHTSQPPTSVKLETAPNLTSIRLSLPAGVSPRVSSLANPNRIVIDLRPDAMVERDILWAEGLRWRQQFINLGTSRFPVVWLEINPRAVGLTLKPIWSDTTLIGTAPILKTAQRYSAAAAINGGFFNRNNKLPLGAIRQDGRWLSSPILNRGAIAWDNSGQVKIGRLNLQENLITSTGQRLPVLTLNSGYVKSGIARYSSNWGSNYTPLIDNEVIVVVQNNSVTAQLPGGIAGKTAFPIPTNGYLLALRASNAANFLPVGTLIRQESSTVPVDFARYPQVLGAGPLLVQNRQIVLNAKSEGFSDAFIRQTAVRSAIGTTAAGNLLITTVHNRAGGAGATLAELAKIMQQLGCVDVLNLDGGSSTSLYLGGQLLDRSPLTAARVHNGLGVFLQPTP